MRFKVVHNFLSSGFFLCLSLYASSSLLELEICVCLLEYSGEEGAEEAGEDDSDTDGDISSSKEEL